MDLKTDNIRWDLSLLYSSIDDPQIDVDVKELISRYISFQKKYKGRLAEKLNEAIDEFSEISMLENKLVFFYLCQSLKVADDKVQGKMAEVDLILNLAKGEYMTFFTIEITALDDVFLSGLYKNDEFLAKHKSWIDQIRIFKPHLLTEEVEGALAKRISFGPHAWEKFFDELESDLEFDFKGQKYSLTEMLNILNGSKYSSEREKALQTINIGLGGVFAKYSAQTLYMVAGSGGLEIKERSYRNPMEARNKSNMMPEEIVDSLHRAVVSVGGPLAKRYYRLKASHLGKKILKWSDRNAPLPFNDTIVIPFDKAIDLVLKAYQSFSPILADIIQKSLDSKWIDAPACKGKKGGAYNYPLVLPGNMPVGFVFLNYLGSSRDVMTLAHELGHNVHGIIAGQTQGPLMFGAPIAYAETASTFGEMTTFKFLLEHLSSQKDPHALLALIMGKIEDSINTVIRQISFSNFERQVHGLDPSYQKWFEPRKLSVQDCDNIWLKTTQELYGAEGDIFTYENTEHLWSYIDHFHRPFYVYSYACGDILAGNLYLQQKKLGEKFEPLYLDFLKAGATKGIIELTKPFGLNPASDSFWSDGIRDNLGVMIEKAENLSRELGVSVK